MKEIKTLSAVALLLISASCGDGDINAEWWHQMLIGLAGAAGSALLALVGRLLNTWTAALAERWKLGFIANLDEVAMGVVQNLHATQVEHWKKAAKDGKLTAEEREQAKAIAIEQLKGLVDGKSLKKAFGGAASTAVEALVEKAVYRSKAMAKTKLESTAPANP